MELPDNDLLDLLLRRREPSGTETGDVAEEDVRQVLEMLRNEFKLTMQLSGCQKLSSITPDMVRGKTPFFVS